MPALGTVTALALWSVSVDDDLPVGALTWGSVPLGSTDDRQFRVCNLSAWYAATDVVVSVIDVGTAATPSVAAQHLFSVDGNTFAATALIGDLNPLTTSPPIIVRRVTPSDAQLGSFTFRVLAVATSWEPPA